MMKRIHVLIITAFMTGGWFIFPLSSALAGENPEELKKQIEVLQKRIEQLEAAQQQAAPLTWGNPNTRRASVWDPFAEMEQMQARMNQMMQSAFHHRGWNNGGMFSNRLDFENDFEIKTTQDGYEINFDMTGMNNENVDIKIDEHAITVKGDYSNEETEEGPDRFISASSYGSFMKTIPVPADADTSKVKTEKEGSRLVITMPKKST